MNSIKFNLSYCISWMYRKHRRVFHCLLPFFSVHLTTFKRIQNYIPGLSQYRFKVARQHSLQYGHGTLLPRPRSLRMQVEDKQLDHFLSCITSPHVIQDVPFGQRYLRLSSCKILETPSVIRTIIPNKLLKRTKLIVRKQNLPHSAQRQW